VIMYAYCCCSCGRAAEVALALHRLKGGNTLLLELVLDTLLRGNVMGAYSRCTVSLLSAMQCKTEIGLPRMQALVPQRKGHCNCMHAISGH
jgi:hypothetical protein